MSERMTPMQAKALEELTPVQALERVFLRSIELETHLQALADTSAVRRDIGIAAAVGEAIEKTAEIRSIAGG